MVVGAVVVFETVADDKEDVGLGVALDEIPPLSLAWRAAMRKPSYRYASAPILKTTCLTDDGCPCVLYKVGRGQMK